MADNFDAVDIMQDILGASVSGAPVYKERPPTDQSGNYIVIRSTGNTSLEVVSVVQLNVNIYVARWANGTVDRNTMKTIRAAVLSLIENATSPAGFYCVIDKAFSAILEDVRKGYDCFTIRFEITLK